MELITPEEIENQEVPSRVDDEIAKWLIDEVKPEMMRLMAENHGVGLTATQIGYPYAFSILRVDTDEMILSIFNAEYYPVGGRNQRPEGCLSYPNHNSIKVKRWKKIRAEYDIWDGEKLIHQSRKLKGFTARVFQHEADHQFGRTIYMKGG